ncbi:MAG: hypothetical protein QN168_04705 [Armatimonadota bacterium]|nr:hypothetical protein [Armatimonadota bacterium]
MGRLAPRARSNTGDLFDDHPSVQERVERPGRAYDCHVPSPDARLVTFRAQAEVGPFQASVASVEFARGAAVVNLFLSNRGGVEIDLFTAVTGATLTDSTGRAFLVRLLRSQFPDRLALGARRACGSSWDPTATAWASPQAWEAVWVPASGFQAPPPV